MGKFIQIDYCAAFAVICWHVLPVSGINSGHYIQGDPCDLAYQPTVLLYRDDNAGTFSIIDRLSPNETSSNDGVTRFLKGHSIPGVSTKTRLDGAAALGDDKGEIARDLVINSDDLFYARECGCFTPDYPPVYCPLEIDTCMKPSKWFPELEPACINVLPANSLRRWNILVLSSMFLILLLFLLCSDMGINVFFFVLAKFSPEWNDYFVQHLLRRDPQQANLMIQDFLDRQQHVLESEMVQGVEGANSSQSQDDGRYLEAIQESSTDVGSPNALALRTRIYHETKNSITNGTTGSSNQCVVCLMGYQEGERVGVLKCGHIFHAECLKLWLQRKNICPLCQMTGIATPCWHKHV